MGEGGRLSVGEVAEGGNEEELPSLRGREEQEQGGRGGVMTRVSHAYIHVRVGRVMNVIEAYA